MAKPVHMNVCSKISIFLLCIKVIASEEFKFLKILNPKFMKEMFELKDISHDLRGTERSYFNHNFQT